MDINKIYENLCYYDKRNPDCTADDEEINDHISALKRQRDKLGYEKRCSCDNCFYGRTEMAEELIKHIEKKHFDRINHKVIEKIRNSKSDAEARKIIISLIE